MPKYLSAGSYCNYCIRCENYKKDNFRESFYNRTVKIFTTVSIFSNYCMTCLKSFYNETVRRLSNLAIIAVDVEITYMTIIFDSCQLLQFNSWTNSKAFLPTFNDYRSQ